MKTKVWAALFTLGCMSTGSVYAGVAAKFVSIAGLVQYRENSGKWQNARVGTTLSPNTELQTGPTGQASILFKNGTTVLLKSGTLVKLDQYTAGAYGTQTNMSLRVGRMSADIAKVNDANVRNHFRVRTPTVVAGVRGSAGDFSMGTSALIAMTEHSIDLHDRHNQKSHVAEGDKTKITTSGTITADKLATQNFTVTMSGQGTTPAEMDMSFAAGDFSFTGNMSDLSDFFSLIDQFAALGFIEQVSFEKL